ncbi:hypothetical protein AK812_SmicGene41291, partial [Symbiodinium microadriaticum]
MSFSARLAAQRALSRPPGGGSLRGFAVLSHVWTGGQRPDASGPQKVCVMMHGILGSKSRHGGLAG